MKMRFWAILCIGMIFSTTSQASMTVSEYLAEEAKQEEGWTFHKAVYVWGLMDGLGAFDDAIRENLGQTLFCVDDVEPATVERLIQEINREIEFARKRVIDFEAFALETTIGDLGLKVLSQLYSCAPKS